METSEHSDFPGTAEDVAFTYDSISVTYGKGRLTGRTDPSGSYTFYYDAHGNLTKEEKTIESVQYTTEYAYDNDNNLTSITYPGGREVTYTLDLTGRITQVDTTLNGNPKTLASSITYLPYGGITGLTYGNSLSLSHGYDNQYRSSSIGVDSVLDRTYEYDANGNVSSLEDDEAVGNEALETEGTYAYDQYTNLLAYVVWGQEQVVYDYDDNANTVSTNDRTYVYDSSNQLIEVWDGANQIAGYTYNGAGQRIKKVTQSGTRIFHYDLWGHLIAETNQSGQMIAEYIYLGEKLLAMIRKPAQTEIVSYFHNDHLGTPLILTNDNQTIVWKAAYTPFGAATISVQTVENPFRLPGQYYDQETGLHYNYFRYYNPQTGRYITPDPIGLEGGINLWPYVTNNPASWVDAFGLYEEDVHFGKTFDWALESGIEPRIAMKIASANQRVDDNLLTNPLLPWNWLFGTIFHYQSRQYAETGLKQSLDENNIEQFGKFLHMLQDTFAHAGYGFPFGHAFRGTKPDQYCEGSKRDNEMKELTFSWLKEFEKRIGRAYHPVIRRP